MNSAVIDHRCVQTLEQLIAAAAVRAGAALGHMLNREIEPREVRFYRDDWREALSRSVNGRDRSLAVSQSAFGVGPKKTWMSVSLMIEQKHAACMLDMIMGRYRGSGKAHETEPGLKVFASTELDVLREAGNVVAGACAAVLADNLGLTGMSPPLLSAPVSLADNIHRRSGPRTIFAEARLKTLRHPLELGLLMLIERPAIGGEASLSTAPNSHRVDLPLRVRRSAARLARS